MAPRTARRATARSTRRRNANHWRLRLIVSAIVAVLTWLAWAALERGIAPTSNTSLTRFDAIIVLGSPADEDGNPTPTQLARVTEAVHEYARNVAPHLILTGGAAHNRFVEASVMARTARAQGIPESAIVEEGQAQDTIQNACYAVRIMRAHGWRSAEVVSTPSHLPRAAMIFSRLPVEWRVHAAPPIEPQSGLEAAVGAFVETVKTARYIVWARQSEYCEP